MGTLPRPRLEPLRLVDGRQLVDVIVLVRTGFGRLWNDRRRYLGTDRTGPEAVAALHFPGLAPQADFSGGFVTSPTSAAQTGAPASFVP